MQTLPAYVTSFDNCLWDNLCTPMCLLNLGQFVLTSSFNWLACRGQLAQLGNSSPTDPVIRVWIPAAGNRRGVFLYSWQFNVQPWLLKLYCHILYYDNHTRQLNGQHSATKTPAQESAEHLMKRHNKWGPKHGGVRVYDKLGRIVIFVIRFLPETNT